MSNIQIPSSIKKISNSVAAEVRANYPNISCLEDVEIGLQQKWEDACDHELFYQDINRFIYDVYQEKTMTTQSGW